jgi:hypothetical protein
MTTPLAVGVPNSMFAIDWRELEGLRGFFLCHTGRAVPLTQSTWLQHPVRTIRHPIPCVNR